MTHTGTAFDAIFGDGLSDRPELRQLAALRHDGACRGWPTEWWYPGVGGSEYVARAHIICQTCPVQASCLAYAIEHRERFGVWGGLPEVPRRALIELHVKGVPVSDVVDRATAGELDDLTDERTARRSGREPGVIDHQRRQRQATTRAAIEVLRPVIERRYEDGHRDEAIADSLAPLLPVDRDVALWAAGYLGFKVGDQAAPAAPAFGQRRSRRRPKMATTSTDETSAVTHSADGWRLEISPTRWRLDVDPSALTVDQRDAFDLLVEVFVPATAA